MNQYPEPPPYPGAPARTEGLATAALILGILSLICLGPLTGIPAIICGHAARGRIARSGGTLAGGGQALAGLFMGYLSIFLLIAGIAIFARFAKEYGPKLPSLVAKPAVIAQHARLQEALVAYKADFGQYPAVTPSDGEQVDTKAMVGILGGKNEKRRTYYDASGSGIQVNGIPTDTWGQALFMAVDLDGDNKVEVGDQEVSGVCAVWSAGPNKQDEQGGGDDVVSW